MSMEGAVDRKSALRMLVILGSCDRVWVDIDVILITLLCVLCFLRIIRVVPQIFQLKISTITSILLCHCGDGRLMGDISGALIFVCVCVLLVCEVGAHVCTCKCRVYLLFHRSRERQNNHTHANQQTLAKYTHKHTRRQTHTRTHYLEHTGGWMTDVLSWW